MNLLELIRNALQEDLPRGDLTTDSLDLADRPGKARLVAKQRMVLSGREVFETTFRELDAQIIVTWNYDDGDTVEADQTICTLQGELAEMLKAERTALNFLGRLSGIATLTSRFVSKTAGTKAKVIDTRKTTPGLRKLEKTAVRHGGGANHRQHLSERILVKENHIRAVGGITNTVELLRKRNGANKPIEVEVTTTEEIQEALACGVDQVLLDNMDNGRIAQAVKIIGNRCLIEASGNMTLDRIESVARLGVDFISVGSLTHSAPSADMSLLFEELRRP